MKPRHVLAAAVALLSMSAAAPAAFACEPTPDAPCVTRIESGFSYSFQSSDRGLRVQTTTWGWVWNPYVGEWQWQAIVQETVQRDHSQQEDRSQYYVEQRFHGWDGWNWNW